MTDIELFRLIAKEFSSVGKKEINAWLDLTKPLVSEKRFGRLYQQAVVLLTAHRMKLSGNYDVVDDGGEGRVSTGSIAETLRVASYHEGDASISFFNSAAQGNTGDADLAMTTYGVQFKALRSQVIVPIMSSGEAR